MPKKVILKMVAEIGRLAVKIAGRDAGRECLIVKKLDKSHVLVDGNTRRRKCNIAHLEILSQRAKIKEDAPHEEVVKALESLGIKVRKKIAREKKPTEEIEPKEEKKIKFPKIKKEAKPKKEPKPE